MKIFFLSLMILFIGCSAEKPQSKLVIPASIVQPSPIENALIVDKDCAPKTWSTEWDKYIIDSLSTKQSLKNYNSSEKYWVAVIKALAKAESCLNLVEYYPEKGLGKDAVTGLGNVSEGLLQLSYQDSKYHGCQFDWSKDKALDKKSLSKTIFNPKLNIECGMIILNKQIEKRGVLETSTPFYWAVLNRTNARYKEFKKYLEAEGF